ncbi:MULTISPECIES: hypothetical protein [unclassified Sinorhizobium]|uniref:hypothetical protein n=1 Tax=unclassified Sinorhizobium TaxID=2613772 RepID=UPI003523E513
METKHTPTPWRMDDDIRFGETPRVYGADKHICEVANAELPIDAQEEWIANAAFIVKACNSHEALIEALKAVEAYLGPQVPAADSVVVYNKVVAALKLVEVEQP